MGFDNVTFWLFLAAVIVASLTFVTIVVWAENRLKERQEFYRFEFRKRLVEAGKMDAGVDRLEMGRTPTSGVLLEPQETQTCGLASLAQPLLARNGHAPRTIPGSRPPMNTIGGMTRTLSFG